MKFRDAVGMPARAQRENGHRERLGRVMPELAEARERRPVDADLAGIIAEILPHQIEREGVIARGHRRVRGEDICRRDDLQRGVKVELVIGDLPADQLERSGTRSGLRSCDKRSA